jgi:hypothetical protein
MAPLNKRLRKVHLHAEHWEQNRRVSIDLVPLFILSAFISRPSALPTRPRICVYVNKAEGGCCFSEVTITPPRKHQRELPSPVTHRL